MEPSIASIALTPSSGNDKCDVRPNLCFSWCYDRLKCAPQSACQTARTERGDFFFGCSVRQVTDEDSTSLREGFHIRRVDILGRVLLLAPSADFSFSSSLSSSSSSSSSSNQKLCRRHRFRFCIQGFDLLSELSSSSSELSESIGAIGVLVYLLHRRSTSIAFDLK